MYFVNPELTIAVERALAPVKVHMRCRSQEQHGTGSVHNPRSLHALCSKANELPSRKHHYTTDIMMVTCKECRSWTSTEERTKYIRGLIDRLRGQGNSEE